MNHHVAFDPHLDLNPQDFIAAWNEAPECRALAQARLAPQPPQGFPIDPHLLQQGLVLLVGAAGGLALEALKDAVKEKLTHYFQEKLSRKPALTVDAVRQPGGAYLLVVTEEDE